MPVAELGAVAQQQRRVVERAADIEAGDGKALRPRVGEKRADGRVQPLRFAQHDVHQLLLLRRERQLLAQDLDRARHRRERISDFVRDAGGHLADRGEPLLHARVALELLDLGEVLERDEESRAAAGRLQSASRSGRCRSPRGRRPSGSGIRRVSRPLRSQPAFERLDERLRKLQDFADRATDDRIGRQTGNRLGRVVERQDALRRVGGGQPARQAVDDVLVERLQVGDLGGRLLEPGPGRAHAFRQRAAQERHGEEAEQVQRDPVLRD